MYVCPHTHSVYYAYYYSAYVYPLNSYVCHLNPSREKAVFPYLTPLVIPTPRISCVTYFSHWPTHTPWDKCAIQPGLVRKISGARHRDIHGVPCKTDLSFLMPRVFASAFERDSFAMYDHYLGNVTLSRSTKSKIRIRAPFVVENNAIGVSLFDLRCSGYDHQARDYSQLRTFNCVIHYPLT